MDRIAECRESAAAVSAASNWLRKNHSELAPNLQNATGGAKKVGERYSTIVSVPIRGGRRRFTFWVTLNATGEHDVELIEEID